MPRLLVLVLLCGLTGRVGAAPPDPGDSGDIPTVGQPTHVPFSGASGQFRIEVKAEPTAVTVEDPLTLRVIVHARGAVFRPPSRIHLDEIPAFTDRFYLKDVGGDGRQIDFTTWEFDYELRPKSLKVREVPGVPLAFYDPEVAFPERRFQIDYSDPIPLTVRPRRVFKAEPPPLPESVYELATGPGLLARQEPPGLPGVWTVVVVLLGAPLLGLGWYKLWQRLYPDGALLARQRRSRAAQVALAALKKGRRLPGTDRAALAAATATCYLRERLGLPMAEPTPDEAAEYLRIYGLAPELAERAARFFRACDVHRFAPTPPLTLPSPPSEGGEGRVRGGVADPYEDAGPFILAVEAATWPAEPS